MEGSDTALPICFHSYDCTHIYVVAPHISLFRRGSESRSAGSGRLLLGVYRTFRECGAGFGPCSSVNCNYNYDIPLGLPCLDRRDSIVRDGRRLAVAMDPSPDTTPGV
jgi:hypothetical protein